MTVAVPHASHWGAFDALVEGGRVAAVRPFARDRFPGSLIASVPDIVHAPSRIDRPYVRRGWLRGERAGAPRGGDPFVPVDWDRAIRLVAGEIDRVRRAHGNTAIFGGSYGWSSAGRFHHARTQLHRCLNTLGGCTGQLTNYSYAAGMTLMPHIVGTNDCITGPATDWPAIIANARVLLCFGGLPLKNGEVCSGGAGEGQYRRWLREAGSAGLRVVNVSPLAQDAPDFLRAEWLPIRPGTDTALMLALAHVIVAEGREDKAFLATHCTGWDRLRAYLLGETDGQPKTPGWAAPITGIAPETTMALARAIATEPTMITAAWSIQRQDYGEQPYWMTVALAAITGGIGRPGTGFAFGYGSINGVGNPRHDLPVPALSAGRNPTGLFIPVARVTDMLEKPGGICEYNGRRIVYPDTKLIWWAGGNPFHHHQDLNRFLRAWARAETIVINEPWWTALARHADIVLPATTTLERNDIAASSRDRFVLAMRQAIPPQAQARDDFAILADICDALGLRDRFTEQRDEAAWLRHLYDTARAGWTASGVETPDFDGFWEAGFLEFTPPERPFVLFEGFRADPYADPLNTPSGKIELYSETIAGFGYDDCPGHPVWKEPKEWLGAPAAARYPLHLLSFQPATRLHGQLDQGRVSLASKVAGREPVLIGPADAAARGIKTGDVVRIFNDRGACLGGAVVTEGILPGVVAMATGAWLDPLEPGAPGSLCVHGNPNVLTRDEGTSRLGQGPVAQSCLVEIERWTEPVPPVRVHAPPPIEEA
ncbi:molybdopterin-dependent oxidoreductase [Elioraea sp. Yellowstone]|jgi:biotin/methionine sulfoxide reductase|uniref:molybdopterin-dependent oxidoreductase n=1 Tax=Elioraea sp. Yellowstone TaxID=2592070 RepID=UPI00114E8401|nr:molybdopterin-dependent oxidoreductase [Elioraea sp. Yellowstone]TQF79253.1 molybdopterin-dependent oxidoreductase [Elioraea sp. Yellowstone]